MSDRTLVDKEILRLCRGCAMVDHYDEALINPCSLDLRVGSIALIEQRPSFLQRLAIRLGRVALSPQFETIDLSQYSAQNPYLLRPNGFILLCTQEIFNLPASIKGKVHLKSSRGREGYDHLMAGFCDPGWNGSSLTMEIKNANQWHALPLYPGLRIAQMEFVEIEVPKAPYSITGRYNSDRSVTPSKG